MKEKKSMFYGDVKSDAYFDTMENESGRDILIPYSRRNFRRLDRAGMLRLFHLVCKMSDNTWRIFTKSK